MAPGRFAKKTVPPGTIRLGPFAQNFDRDCSHKITGTVRSKFNLQGQCNAPFLIFKMKIIFFFFFFFLRLSFHLF